jgi:hypothetical protein
MCVGPAPAIPAAPPVAPATAGAAAPAAGELSGSLMSCPASSGATVVSLSAGPGTRVFASLARGAASWVAAALGAASGCSGLTALDWMVVTSGSAHALCIAMAKMTTVRIELNVWCAARKCRKYSIRAQPRGLVFATIRSSQAPARARTHLGRPPAPATARHSASFGLGALIAHAARSGSPAHRGCDRREQLLLLERLGQ